LESGDRFQLGNAAIPHFAKLLNKREKRKTMGEMGTAAILPPLLIMIGLGVGFLLLKLQGGEE
jgi:hypothetical protein